MQDTLVEGFLKPLKTLKYAIITQILAIDILYRTLGDDGGAAEISRESRARAH